MRSIYVKGVFLLFAVCFVILFNPFLAGKSSSEDTNQIEEWTKNITKTSEHPRMEVLTSTPKSFRLKVKCEGFDYKSEKNDGEVFERIWIDQCPVLEKPGFPELPFIRKLIAVPENDNIKINYEISEHKLLSKINVYPSPRIVEDRIPDECIMVMREVFHKDESAYSLNEYFPQNIVEIKKTFKIRNQNVAEIFIYPLRYNAHRKEIFFIKEIDIALDYVNPSGPVCVSTGPLGKVCENSLVNYGPELDVMSQESHRSALGSGGGTFQWCLSIQGVINNNTDYLVVVGHNLATYLPATLLIEELGNKRASFNGFNVSAIDIENMIDITGEDDDVTLKTELMDIYENTNAEHFTDNKIGFILFIGDAYDCPWGDDTCPEGSRTTIIPTHYAGTPHGDEYIPVSDMYFASMDDIDDMTPDVYIGRLSVDDYQECEAIINKILDYEPHNKNNDWHKRVLYVRGVEYDINHNPCCPIGGGILQEEYLRLTPPGFTFECHEVDPFDSAKNNSAGVKSAIGNGCGLLAVYAHGMEYYFGHTFYPRDYEALDNAGNYAVVYGFSCATAHFDLPCHREEPIPPCGHPDTTFGEGHILYSPAAPVYVDRYDCVAERIMNIPETGAVAYVGYSRSIDNYEREGAYFYSNYFLGTSLGESVLTTFYQIIEDHAESLVLIGDPVLNTFYEEYPGSPEGEVELCIFPDETVLSQVIFDSDEDNYISVVIQNSGPTTAYNVDVAMEIDSTPTSTQTVDSLVPHNKYNLVFSVNEPDLGNHEVAFIVNPDETIDEIMTHNNRADTMFSVMDIKAGFPFELQQTGGKSFPVIYNSNNDQQIEILINQDGQKLSLIDYAGSEIASQSFLNTTHSYIPVVGPIVSKVSYDILVVEPRVTDDNEVTLSLYDAEDLHLINHTNVQVPGISGTDRKGFYAQAYLYDLDNDGACELVYIERYVYYADTYEGFIAIYESDLSGQFTEVASIEVDYSPNRAAIEDIDYDNRAEIVVLGFAGNPLMGGNLEMVVDVLNLELPGTPEIVSKNAVSFDAYSINIGCVVYNLLKGDIALVDVNNDNVIDIAAGLNKRFITLDGSDSLLQSVLCDITFNFTDGWNLVKTGIGYGKDISDNVNELYVCVNNIVQKIIADSEGCDTSSSLTLDEEYKISAGPLVGDITDDGVNEFIILRINHYGDYDHMNDRWGGKSEVKIEIYDENMNLVSGWSADDIWGINEAGLSLGDLDTDGMHELILQTDKDLYVLNTLWGSSGDIYWGMEDRNTRRTNTYARLVRGESGSEDICLMGDVEVRGDLVINETSKLCISPGTNIGVACEDADVAGSDTTKVEIICYGEIEALGLERGQIKIGSIAVDPQPDDWYGLILEDNSVGGLISSCNVSEAYIGITIKQFQNQVNVIKSYFNNNKYGIWIEMSNPTIYMTNVWYNENEGIRVKGSFTYAPEPLIDQCDIRGNFHGMLFDKASGIIQNSKIRENGYFGLACFNNNSSPEIKNTEIVDNVFGGVGAYVDATPILGDIGQDKGMNNSIYNSQYYVYQAYSSPSTYVMAENCYWGTQPMQLPDPNKFYGNIDFIPFLWENPLEMSISKKNDISTSIYYLSQNYPNPFKSGNTTIQYSIPYGNEYVTLRVYDVTGRRVKTLVDGVQAAGKYQVAWDGRNDMGRKVSPGIYFYRLIAGQHIMTKKLIYLH